MSYIRLRSTIVSLGIASMILVGLFFGVRDHALGASGALTRVEMAEEVAFQVPSAQSTTPVTTYLPSILRYYPPPPTVFGVQLDVIDDAHGLQEAVDSGTYWVRCPAFAWDRIEPVRTNPPTYDWTAVDETSLRNAYANRLKVIAVLQFAPIWAQKYPGSTCGPIAQAQFDEYAQYLTALVNRYKNPPYGIKYWELGNEPDAPLQYDRQVFGCWGQIGDPYYGGRYYGEMLKIAYQAIKSADPTAQVLVGGLLLDRANGGTDSAPRFLEGILAAGAGPYFDALAFHAYAYYGGVLGQMRNTNWPGSVTAIPEKTAFVRQVLGRYGHGNKPLMNTEAALLCTSDSINCQETQAMYVPRAYAEAMALGLQAQVYFALMNEGWYYTGLLRPDRFPKPAYHAYDTATGFLRYTSYEGAAPYYRTGVTGYAFRRNDNTGHVDVIWSVDGAERTVTLPAGTVPYDKYGTALTNPIYVGPSPVYIKRP